MSVGGIYCIVCKASSKVYVGRTFDFKERMNAHFSALRGEYHFNSHLQRSFRKYGVDSFMFFVLEVIGEEEARGEREQHWCDYLQSLGIELFNRRVVDVNSTRGIKQDEEWIQKRVQSFSGFKHSVTSRQKMSEAMRGQKRRLGFRASDETRRKLSNAHKGRKLSDQHRQNIAKCQHKPVEQISKQTGEVLRVFPSVKDAGLVLEIHTTSISAACLGKRKSAGGFRWNYVVTAK